MKKHIWRVVCLSLVMAGLAPGAATRPPNVVFILADDLGWNDTTLYGGTKFLETPQLERLAARGMTFTRAYAANPLCSPTRASLLTGLYPGRIGITSPCCHEPAERLESRLVPRADAKHKALQAVSASRLTTNHVTLAEVLKAQGYVTGHFGKWHLGPEPYSALQQGFDVDVPHYPGPGPAGTFIAPWKFPAALKFTGTPGEHIEDRMASEAEKFLRANRDRPFFLNYWAFSVHAPFDGKKSLIEKYRAKADPNNPQRCPVYGAMVESLDDAVGQLMRTLDELKLTDNTIIVFFSDNGGNMYDRVEGIPPTSNAPLRGGKATLYEGGSREPCVVVWPGRVKPGSRSDALASSVDFLPTLLEMTGFKDKGPEKIDGVSQVPALLGKGTPREEAFSFFPHYVPATGNLPGTWIIRGNWKLIRFHHDGPEQEDRFELYDLAADVGEQHDVSGQHPDVVRDLDARIGRHLAAIGASVPTKNPAYRAAPVAK